MIDAVIDDAILCRLYLNDFKTFGGISNQSSSLLNFYSRIWVDSVHLDAVLITLPANSGMW